jgi:hypothetical protein
MLLCRLVTLALGAVVLAGTAACDSVLHRGELPPLTKFEGEIDFVAKGTFAKGSVDAVPVAVFVKEDKLRFDPPEASNNGGGSFLIDSPAKRFFVINPARKQAIQFDLSAGNTKHVSGGSSVTKTGRKSSVAGFGCEEWDVTDGGVKKESICVADQPASFFNVPLTGGMLGSRAWLVEVLDGQHFPLRLVAFDKAGAETGSIELVRITRKPEDADLFAIGDGIQTVDIGALLQGSGAPPGASGFGGHDTTRIPARPPHP